MLSPVFCEGLIKASLERGKKGRKRKEKERTGCISGLTETMGLTLIRGEERELWWDL